MTPCEKLGYKVGDTFVVVKENTFSVGSLVSLYEDDGTDYPLFKLITGECEHYCCDGDVGAFTDISNVSKLGNNSKESQELSEESYTKVIHEDGRIEFIPKKVEAPEKPKDVNYVDWTLNVGEEYHCVWSTGEITQNEFENDPTDKGCIQFYNTYPTEALVEKASKLMRRSNAIIKACLLVDPEFTPDWEKFYAKRVRVDYNHYTAEWEYTFDGYPQTSVAYVSSEEKAKEVCALLTKWGVK